METQKLLLSMKLCLCNYKVCPFRDFVTMYLYSKPWLWNFSYHAPLEFVWALQNHFDGDGEKHVFILQKNEIQSANVQRSPTLKFFSYFVSCRPVLLYSERNMIYSWAFRTTGYMGKC